MDKVLCPWCGSEMKLEESLPYCFVYAYVCECGAVSPNECGEKEAYAAAIRRPLQKPLTLEEACESNEPCVYFEFGRSGFAPIKAALITKKQDENGYEAVILGAAKPIPFFANMYGSVLRCWATKPSDEEREAAKWE